MENKDERILNITRHEATLNKMDELVQKLDVLQQEWSDMRRAYDELVDYYYSDTRNEDLELDEKDDFFGDLPRGVLSEDAIYNMMVDNSQVAFRFMRTALDYLEP